MTLFDTVEAENENQLSFVDDLQYSTRANSAHYDYSKPFAEQVEDWKNGKIPKNDTLILGGTPKLYQQIGLSALPMTIDQTHVDYAINGTKNADHSMGEEMLKKLPEFMQSPVAIIESTTRPNDSLVAIVQGEVNGHQMMAAVEVGGIGQQNGDQINVNSINSAYGRSNAITKLLNDAIQKENAGQVGVYYLKKSEARSLYARPGVQFPGTALQDGLNHSIFDAGSPVNKKFLPQTETRQFKKFFGKSKLVNEDGTPKALFHQTGAKFTTFSTDKPVAGQNDSETPTGIFMKDNDNDIGIGGDIQMQLYGRMERPLYLANRSEAVQWYTKNIPGYAEANDAIIQNDAKWDPIYQSVDESFDRIYEENYDAFVANDQAAVDAIQEAENELDKVIKKWQEEELPLRRKAKAILYNYFLRGGSEYDGIILEYDGKRYGKPVKSYIFFNPTQIKSATDNIGLFDPNNPNIQFSLRRAPSPIEPTNDEWARGATFAEVKKKHPTLFALDTDGSEKRNPTQIRGTKTTYGKIYDMILEDGGAGKDILDASSGLGDGTRLGREEYGMNVEDVEPYPDAGYAPMYTDYTAIDKQYDYIISNAVLNVLPQDLRDDAVYTMSTLLKDGGKMYINVRGDDVTTNKSNIAIDAANMEYFVSSTGSYQKGFTSDELVAYLQDALGDGYTATATKAFGKVSAVVEKRAGGMQYSMRKERHTPEQQRVIDEYNAAVDPNIVEMARAIKESPETAPKNYVVSEVNNKAAQRIEDLTGASVTGYEHVIDQSFFRHIEKRHGEHGAADKSMSDVNDIARVGYVLNNCDLIEPALDKHGKQRYSYGFKDKNGNNLPIILYSKRIDGKMYIAEAVGETSTKKIHLVSAYIRSAKQSGELTPYAEAQSLTSETPHLSTNNSIFDSTSKSNMNNLGSNNVHESSRQTDPTTDRQLLADAFDSVAETPLEKEKLAQYKAHIDTLNKDTARLDEVNAEIRRLSFAPGTRDDMRRRTPESASNDDMTILQTLTPAVDGASEQPYSRERADVDRVLCFSEFFLQAYAQKAFCGFMAAKQRRRRRAALVPIVCME